ncbi:MAG: tetratricopeptide repeat protein, partial [Blastocatellia bacterium]|nr:tetratricopeptide repeat protein [Blastocatellia bacterium]
MKYAVLFLALLIGQGVAAQTPKPKATPAKKAVALKPKPTPSRLTEKDQFAKASAHELAADRVAALEKFLAAFPQSENRQAAVDLIASSRALIAEEKLMSGSAADAVVLFRKVVNEAPQPIPNDLFNESISKIPSMLFRYGERPAAFEVASLIESKVEDNSAHLLEIASFYLNIENGSEAMRVAAKAAAKDPTSASVYRALALAHRINFDLDAAANAYAKALELEPASSASRRGLAEMKRALGKSDEAATLYRDLLAKNEADVPARTGLVLALFDSGKRDEAEIEMTTALQKAPSNFVLLAGAAYWYASRGIGEKAVELAEKALALEPRYVWSHIALARGLMARGKPVAAEQVLVGARAHGNFPTLEYEIASARMASGFFRDAVEDLAKQFTVTDAGVKTNLGGRVAHVERSLAELVAFERKASIFTPVAADTIESSETLRALLELDQKFANASLNEAEITVAVDAFVKGADKMKVHRQIYAAGLLLEKRTAVGKALELTKAATGASDTGLDVPDPGAAVMASELYESRVTAFRKGEFLLVPAVPRQTLSAILRGRIEELTGWALYQQGKFPDAVIRLRRSISVMPDKSAWWRSSMWRLGSALASDGKDAEALHAYIESYKTDKPDFGKYAVVESLYRKINGTTDGLGAKIGAERVAAMSTSSTIAPVPTPEVPASSSSIEVVEPAAVTASDARPIEVK